MGETVKNDIVADIENAEVLSFGKKDLNYYNSLLSGIEKGFTKASEAYVLIARNLWQINHNEYFRIEHYKTIADFGLDKYEMKKSTVHNYVKVMDKFGVIEDGRAIGLKEQFKKFKCSQLVNMLTFTPEQIEQVQPDWSVRKIIEFGKSPLLLEDDEDESNVVDTTATETDIEHDSYDNVMNTPDVQAGRTFLMDCLDFDDILKDKDRIINAYNDMKKDKNFAGKNIRLVLELAYD